MFPAQQMDGHEKVNAAVCMLSRWRQAWKKLVIWLREMLTLLWIQGSLDQDLAVGNEVVIPCPKGQIKGKIISVHGNEAQLVVTQPITSLGQTMSSSSPQT